jgi:poly-gamma-glutamate synthesis protein (capsule biosynthesis protein)
MLGRGVASALERDPAALVEPAVAQAIGECDLCIANLECCVSSRGSPWPAPGKPFFFRAPPAGAELLAHLGVDCVTLANNHALDYGVEALIDTFEHLRAAGIAWVGAGVDLSSARRPAVLGPAGARLGVVALADHPADFAASETRPGIAYADLRHGDLPAWVADALAAARTQADAVLVSPHWGPNMVSEPLPRVRAAAEGLLAAGATLVAGHSAHIFQGVCPGVLFDLGDFLDDYAVNPKLRNDLGLLWFVELELDGPRRIEALPLKLSYCHTQLAHGDEAAWIAGRLARACSALGGTARWERGRLVVQTRISL